MSDDGLHQQTQAGEYLKRVFEVIPLINVPNYLKSEVIVKK